MDNNSREIRDYIDTLKEYDKLYNLGTPIISDKTYDEIYFLFHSL